MDRSERARTHLLVVEDDAAMREFLRESLVEEGYRVDVAASARLGISRVHKGGIDLVVTDVKMPDMDGLDLLAEVKAPVEGHTTPHVIVVTAFGSIETAKRALKLGAHDYITKPFEVDDLVTAIDKALGERLLRKEVARLRKEVAQPYGLDNIIGHSAPMQEVFALIRRLQTSMVNVLVTGESGTGKELVARALHYNSPRAKAGFVAVNCAAIPDTLLESELFGYKRGAFTDARTDRNGLFVEANGGTIFLDEIGDLTPPLQAKLLRVLQEREVRPLGATKSEKVDVRVVSATNRDLSERMRDGSFREDLYYRLNVIEVMLPPLRERSEDVGLLIDFFLGQSGKRTGKPVSRCSPAAMKVLLSYNWPGNVRELENVMERAVALCETEIISPEDLPIQVRNAKSTDVVGGAIARNLTLADVEREYISRVLQAEGGNKTRAAARLGLDRKTLYRKLEDYGKLGGAEGVAAATTPPPVVSGATPPPLPADVRAALPTVDADPEPEGIEPEPEPEPEPQSPPRVEQTVPIPRFDLMDDEPESK